MFYYRYNDKDELIEKSNKQLDGDNVVAYYEDLDIGIFRIIVGYISEDGIMLRHTKFIRSAELISAKFDEIRNNQLLSELDIDFRLSILELGLIQ